MRNTPLVESKVRFVFVSFALPRIWRSGTFKTLSFLIIEYNATPREFHHLIIIQITSIQEINKILFGPWIHHLYLSFVLVCNNLFDFHVKTFNSLNHIDFNRLSIMCILDLKGVRVHLHKIFRSIPKL